MTKLDVIKKTLKSFPDFIDKSEYYDIMMYLKIILKHFWLQ